MADDSFSTNTINVKDMNGDIAMFGSDKDLVPVFYAGTRLNAFKSQSAGTAIYDPVDMLKVYHPGEPLNVPERPVNELDKRRFRAQWEAYKEGKDQRVEGTPLSVLFPHQPEIIKTMEAMHVRTIQQLANISDTGTQNMMFGFNLREKAQKYLAIAEKGAEYHKIEMQLADRDQQIKELSEAVALLKAQMLAPAPAPTPVVPAPAQSSEIAALQQTVASLAAAVASAAKPKYGRPYKPRKPKVQDPAPAPQTA